jgi:hypothetical protein
MSDAESVEPNVVGMTPSLYPAGTNAPGSTIEDLMNASSGSPALAASPFRSSSAGPTAAVVPAAASAWQLPHPPLPVKIALPLSTFPAAPDVEPPVDPPPVTGGGVEVGVDAGPLESDAVESGNWPTPTLDAPLVVVPERTITTIMTTTPATVPMSPATRTLIMAARTISGGAAGANTASRGYMGPRRTPTDSTMLDKRDIQTLMYCIRVAETAGLWQQGHPARSPNDLECKLAELMRQIEAGSIRAAA